MNPLLLILLLPILEIVGFIQVGDWIGAGPTIGLLALSAVVGVLLVRHRGLGALTRAQAAAARGEAPIGTVLDGFCAVLAGILLIIPGFLSDLVGLALLVPALRRGIGRWLLRRIGSGMPVFTTMGTGMGPGMGAGARPGAGFGADFDPAGGPASQSGPDSGAGPFRPSAGFSPGVIDGDYRDVTPDKDAKGPATGEAPRLSDSQWGKRDGDGRH